MKKELPHVYSNPIDKEIRNNTEYFYSRNNSPKEIKSPKDISKLANQIFSRKDFVYKTKVKVTTFDNEIETTLVGRTNTTLLTLDGLSIPIVNITDLTVID